MNHESIRECGRKFSNGKACECQASYYAEDETTSLRGYWCTKCGAYRGFDGERPGRIAQRNQDQPSKN